MNQTDCMVNENKSVGANGLLACKAAANLAIPNGASKSIDVTAKSADTQKTDSSSEKSLSIGEPVPGCSRQTENRQDALQGWLEETYSRLFFLSKNESSASFISFVSLLKDKQDQRETIEKSIIEFLLALNKFYCNSPSLLLPTHHFIKNLFDKYRLLIDDHRAFSANFSKLREIPDQSKKIEAMETLRQEIENLEKEKAALLKKQEELNLEQLTELTNDLKKFKSERSRNFPHEIALNKKQLEDCKTKLAEISKGIRRKLSFAEKQQLVPNIKLKSRNILNLEIELEQIDEMLEKLDQFRSSNIIDQQKQLEEEREKLRLKKNNIDPEAIVRQQLESNSLATVGSEKVKIETALEENRLELEKLTALIRNLANLTPTNDSYKLNAFIKKINANLSLAFDKKKREEEQEKIKAQYKIIEKELAEIDKELGEAENSGSKKDRNLEQRITLLAQKKSKLEDDKRELDGQLALKKELLDSVREAYYANQEELITLLDEEEPALINLIKQLLEKKRIESKESIIELTKEKKELELFEKKNRLDEEKRELEKQLCKIEKDESVWSRLAGGKLIRILGYREVLQARLNESENKLDKLEKKLDKLEKKLEELKEKFAKLLRDSGKDINKCRNDIHKCETDLKEQIEGLQVLKNVDKQYREQTERIINEQRECNLLELQQNEESLQSNSQKINRLKEQIEWLEAKERVKEVEDRLLQTVVASLEDNNTTAQPENLLCNSFTVVLRELKEQVDGAEWDTHGWGFFCKKVPDGIQKIRLLLNQVFNDLSLDGGGLQHYEQNLFMLSRFSDIYRLIKQKNSSKKCLRSSGVKRLYQSVEQRLEPLYTKINPDLLRALNSMPTSNQAFESLNTNLFKEQALELSEDGIQFLPTLSSGSSC